MSTTASPSFVNDPRTVYLLDGSGYVFRAYHAMAPLRAPDGTPTGATYGFCNMLLRLLKTFHPQYLAIAFDTKHPTFRHQLYSQYKANRTEAPEELIAQLQWIYQLVDAWGICRLVQPGWEADDLLGTATRIAQSRSHPVCLVSSDKDLMQLVGDGVWMLRDMQGQQASALRFVDKQAVVDKMGVPPSQIADLLALAGDASDNIPGVSGIGPKTAATLLQQYGDLENVLQHAAQLPQKARRERLLTDADNARLSRKLVDIDCHMQGEHLSLDDWVYTKPNTQQLFPLFTKLGFHRLLQHPLLQTPQGDLRPASPRQTRPNEHLQQDPAAQLPVNVMCITCEQELKQLLPQLQQAASIALYAPTDPENSLHDAPVGLALSWQQGQAVYIPLKHRHLTASSTTQLSPHMVVQQIANVLRTQGVSLVAADAKQHLHTLKQMGFTNVTFAHDPLLAAYLLDAHDDMQPRLQQLCQQQLNAQIDTRKQLCGSGKQEQAFAQLDMQQAAHYSGQQAQATWLLLQHLQTKLQQHNLQGLYNQLEMPLQHVLQRMESIGVLLDTMQLQQLGQQFASKLQHHQQQAWDMAGHPFNLASPQQVSHVLFDKLGLQKGKTGKTGPSTDASVLQQLAKTHPLPKLLLQYRHLAKLKSTYTDALPQLINPHTGRLHTRFNLFVTATGRLSSSDPNLQNIPVRTPEGMRIRRAFVADAGDLLIGLDYSQIELRILAHLSQDPVLMSSFEKEEDVHQRTASEIFGVAMQAVDSKQRSIAKTINFGLMYGMGAFRLSRELQISLTEAKQTIERYYERYKGVARWQQEVIEQAKQTKEVRTLWGRLRQLPHIASANRVLASRFERFAINTPVQGTQADIIKQAMLNADMALRAFPRARMLLQVHDELVLQAPQAQAQQVCDAIQTAMTQAAKLRVPLVVNTAIGRCWADLSK
ncbi:MAG: DNA polymerase I [Myxococcota bacterium]